PDLAGATEGRGELAARVPPLASARRARARGPPFARLAASQVGYGPSMVKQFSSPKRFASFQEVSTSVTEINAEHAQGPWVHASDAALAPPRVVKGWYDAGDFSVYTASTNSARFW